LTIPRIMHQTAQSLEIPPEWRRYQQIARTIHADWEYRFWTDADNDRFVASEFPELLRHFRNMPFGIMRADVIRYLILYRVGGLYVDLDYEFFRGFDFLDENCVLPSETEAGIPQRLGNAIFASAPKHKFLEAVVDDLRRHPPDARSHDDVLGATGPLFLTRIYNGVSVEVTSDICVPEKRLFSPTTPRGGREYRALVARGDAYGVHHCHGTWRNFSKLQRVKQHLAKLAR